MPEEAEDASLSYGFERSSSIGFGLASATHDWSLYAVLPGSKSVRGAELREALTALCCLLAMLEFRSRYKRERQEHLATTAPA